MNKGKPMDILLNNPNLELCSICGLKKKLTFEHMPPRASGNTNPVNILGLENMTPLGGYLQGKFKKSPKGMGGYKLCEECNNLTGSWYGESYIELSNQINGLIVANLGASKVEFFCKIKPLNFLKQVVSLLLCSDQATGLLRSEIQKTNFILDKEKQEISDKIFISKNITLQSTFGFKGFTMGWDSKNGFSSNIEFIYRPFYFRGAFKGNEISEGSIDLIKFKEYRYNEEIEIGYKLDLSNFKLK
jgi:hypothetical protein